MKIRMAQVASSKVALEHLAALTAKSIKEDKNVRIAALQITSSCGSRARTSQEKVDRCSIEAIYKAVKYGHPAIHPEGLRYVSDPTQSDHFVRPGHMLTLCGQDACGEDCDGHASLIVALLGSIGFYAGLRAYAKPSEPDFSHVYAVVGWPKLVWPPREVLGLDTTVPEAKVGWEPPSGKVRTAWIR